MPDRFEVQIAPSQYVTAINYVAAAARRAGVTLILGHGAGAGQTSRFMVSFATALAVRDRHRYLQLSLYRARPPCSRPQPRTGKLLACGDQDGARTNDQR